MQSHSQPFCRAFTLVELLVTMALLAVFSVVVFNVVGGAGDLSTSATARLESSRLARECLDLIERDLQRAVLPYNRYAASSIQMVASPANIAAAYANPHSLFWQAPLARSSASGNLSVVGYFVFHEFSAAEPDTNRFQLRRLYIEPASPDYRIYSGNDWFGNDLLAQFSPASAAVDNQNAQKGWVADGVIAIWVRCLDPDGNPITLDANGASTGYTFDSRLAYRMTNYKPPASFNALPAYVEVGLVCCSPREMKRITSIPSMTTSSNPANFSSDMTSFTRSLQTTNKGAKSIISLSRKIRIYAAGL